MGIGIVGGLVLLAGIAMLLYPGPGWLVVITGLAILATEFIWARRLLDHVKARYEAWTSWLKRQHWVVKLLALVGTALIVLVTLWLLNALALAAGWWGIDWGWVQSPLF